MSVVYVRCSQGHVFDRDRFEACPTCGEVVVAGAGTTGASERERDQGAAPRPPVLSLPTVAGLAGLAALAVIALVWWHRAPPSEREQPPPTPTRQVDGAASGTTPADGNSRPEPIAMSGEQGAGQTTAKADSPPQPSGAREAGSLQGPAPESRTADKAGAGGAATKPSSPVDTRGSAADVSEGEAGTPTPPRPAQRSEPSGGAAGAGQAADITPTTAVALDPQFAALETKYGLTPLARELLATTRGCFAYGRNAYALAVAWLTSDAARDNPAAMHWLGIMHEKGRGVAQDYREALRLITAAAEAGFYYAQVRLAEIYLHGEYPGVARDADQGRRWLTIAAKEDRPDTRPLLAEAGLDAAAIAPTMTDFDRLLDEQPAKAYRIASELAALNVSSSRYWVAMLGNRGYGGQTDEAANQAKIEAAARLYVSYALRTLAQHAAYGIGRKKNPVEAVALFGLTRVNVLSNGEAEYVDSEVTSYMLGMTQAQHDDLTVLLRDIWTPPRR
jgi:TPR repeat protein